MGQPCQHLAHARAADAEDIGQLLFAQLGAGLQAMLEDGDVDPLVDLIDGVLALDAGGGLARSGGHGVWMGMDGRLHSIERPRPAAGYCHWNSSPQPSTCAVGIPASRSMPQTVVLTVSSKGIPSSRATCCARGAARKLVQQV